MVGRLVEQEQIRPAKQNLRKFNAHIPTLGESLGRSSQFIFTEAQAEQGPAGLHLGRFAMGGSQAVIEVGQTLCELEVGIRLIVSPFPELASDFFYFSLLLPLNGERAHSLFQHGSAVVVLHDLRQVAYGQMIGLVNVSGSRALNLTNEFHDG